MNDNQPQLNSPERPTRAATAYPQPDSEVPANGYQPIDTHNALTGRDLRYVLTTYITQGFSTVGQLVKKLAEDGYTVWGRASQDRVRRPPLGNPQRQSETHPAGAVRDQHHPAHHTASDQNPQPGTLFCPACCRYKAEHRSDSHSPTTPTPRPKLATMAKRSVQPAIGASMTADTVDPR